MSGRLLKICIALLLIASLLLFGQRGAWPGLSFFFILASLACLALAFLLLLFLPWQNPRLRAAGRLLRRVYLALGLIFLLSFIIVQSLIWHTATLAQAEEPDAPCLLVLGAGLFKGEYPSYVLQNRLQAARDYLRSHPHSLAVLSGGQGPNETVTEAWAMRRWLVNNGIEEGRLHMEERSTSTYENIAFSLPIIRGLGQQRAVIVTNDFHLLRSSLIAEHYGLETQLLVAPTPRLFLVPATYYTREYFALIKAWLLLNIFTGSLPLAE